MVPAPSGATSLRQWFRLLESVASATLIRMQNTLILEGGRLLDPAAGTDVCGDVILADGQVVSALPRNRPETRIDLAGAWVLSGLLDLHAHFREPGGEASETLETGARAAARGGFTRVVTMPNTSPPMDDPERLARQIAASATLPVDLLPAVCCTRGRAGREPADLRALHACGARAFTDDGSMVADDTVMEQVMRLAVALDGVVMDHAVVPERAAGGVIRAGRLADQLGLPVFPDAAETEAVARDLRLCRATGCRTHLQHLSCAGSVALLRAARREGIPVSAEATPHHLLLALEDIPGDDADWKMNPPLGTRADIRALRAAVLDGTIDCLATDHAPHAAFLKEGGFRRAMFGVLGLETAVGATLQALVVEEDLPPLAWAAAWTLAPARVLRLPPPALAPGSRADLCVVRPGNWTVRAADLASRSRNSPFLGRELFGRVELTLRAGRITHSLRDDLAATPA